MKYAPLTGDSTLKTAHNFSRSRFILFSLKRFNLFSAINILYSSEIHIMKCHLGSVRSNGQENVPALSVWLLSFFLSVSLILFYKPTMCVQVFMIWFLDEKFKEFLLAISLKRKKWFGWPLVTDHKLLQFGVGHTKTSNR